MKGCLDIGERIQSTPISWQLLFSIQQEHCDLSSTSFHFHSIDSIHKSNHLLVQIDLYQITNEQSNGEGSKVWEMIWKNEMILESLILHLYHLYFKYHHLSMIIIFIIEIHQYRFLTLNSLKCTIITESSIIPIT